MSDFVSFARTYGLRLDHVIADGRWHRVSTEDKPRRKNGAYLYDGERGVVKNFATMEGFASFRNGTNTGQVDRATLRARRVIAEAETKAKQEDARRMAQRILDSCRLETHPYLERKGFPREFMPVREDGLLVIPMREFRLYRQLNSLQTIAADGSKLFLPGGKAKGSVFMIGPFTASERWLCEGYATALSIRAALASLYREAQIIVTFSAGNLAYIGRLVKELRPKAYVMADHDESGAGERAAKETGLPWVMPPQVGEDANDYHQRAGVRALANLMREVSLRQAA